MELTEQDPKQFCDKCKRYSEDIYEKGFKWICKKCKGIRSLKGRSITPKTPSSIKRATTIQARTPSISQVGRPDGR